MKDPLESDAAVMVLDRSRALDYLSLTKPELTLLSVLTTLAGFLFGNTGGVDGLLLFHTLVGTALVGGGAGALNQYIERRYDAMMHRTERRPIPSGRVSPRDALMFGSAISAAGLAELVACVTPLTGALAVATIATYLFLYTPMKRLTPAATMIGAIPGALPPVMGWTAARNDVAPEAWFLFGILFLWQMPHFLSLAWLYRNDYSRAGYRLLVVRDESGKTTSMQILGYTLALVPFTLFPLLVAGAPLLLFLALGVLNVIFAGMSVQFAWTRSNASARRLFLASLAYLPASLGLFVVSLR